MQMLRITLIYLISTCFFVSSQIDNNCDYFQQMVMGKEYFIYNREYPNLSHPLTSCRWSAQSPIGTVISLSCDVNIPQSPNCGNDKLLISFAEDNSFRNAQRVCGKTSFAITSPRNTLTIGLFSGSRSSGGRFLCSLSSVRVAPQWCSCSFQEETKIVGGQETKVNEFPWMAALVDIATRDAFCGASIISQRYAITAAHCLLNIHLNNLGLLVGDHDLSTGSDTPAAALYSIRKINPHPMYNNKNNENDIAIVETTRNIVFSVKVTPVCLPFLYGTTTLDHQVVTVLGWGYTDIAGYKSDVLQEVNLSVVPNNVCSQYAHQKIHSTQICTYAPGKDSCLSDSGGPLLWKHFQRGKYQLVGLVSFGHSCASDVPAVNTRITSFLPWIVSATSDNAYCLRY